MTIELTAAEMAFSLCVEADRMEENGDLLCFDVRAAACLVDQLAAVLSGEFAQTGSRVYGTYSKASSDWDFYAIVSEKQLASLLRLGWRTGATVTSKQSLYKCGVNLLMCDDHNRFDLIAEATRQCIEANPSSRNDVIEIWKELGL